ncbi:MULTISPECIES: DUF2659 family protein [Rickettsieae]|uniref:DUF2659 family protein n=1 Tax=Rickettsieae TaxID=33988 RepID=UPI000B9C686D|nr:DUF2659 family protein [Rickettsia endosymbiont of Culicoides newsteadi]OZG31534.1 hypothetical protein RiCNE_10690 [Rickettsia endosymbiont of Culicoides newsteadi]HJD56570.1 DUF2659 family protein [Rickettsia endosymbiont of Sericostoma sp. HW-2014]
MTDILQEVLSDKNEEKKLYYFKKILPITIILTLIVILFMLINNWRDRKAIENNQKTGDILAKSIALINDNKELAIKSLDNLMTTSTNKVSGLAAIEQASIKIHQGDFIEARTLLKKVIDNNNYDELTNAYAHLVWLSLMIDEPNSSDVNTNEIEKYLNYFDDENKPFFGTANIIKAIWYINNNSKDLAEDTLKKLISLESTTQTVKEQAKALLANLQ